MTTTGEDGRTLLTPGEIARIAGVGPSAVSNWRKRSEDFPQPVARTGHVELFDLTEVLTWLRDTGKVTADEDGDIDAFLFHQADHLRDLGSTDALAAVLTLLAALGKARTSGDDPATWADLPAVEVENRLRSAAKDAAVLGNLSPNELDDYVTRLPRLLPGFRDLITLYTQAANPDRLAGSIVDRYMTRFGRTYEAEHYTTATLRRTVAALAWAPASPRRTILDPACGLGGLLAATVVAADTDDITVYGSDINHAAATVTRSRFSAAGTVAHITATNTLLHDPFPNLNADAVVCDPPFGLRSRDQQIAPSLAASLGRSGQPSLDLAWAYYAVDHLAPTGRAVILTAPGALFRGGNDAQARFELLRRGCVHAIIALPADAGGRTSLAPVALILRAANSPDSGRDVLFVDASDTDVWNLPNQNGGDLIQLAGLVNDPTQRASLTTGQNETVTTVRVLDLLAPGETLNPGRWLTPNAIDPETRRQAVAERTTKLAALYEFMNNFVYLPISPTVSEEPRIVTVGDLVDSGALRLHRAPVIQRSEFTEDGIDVLTTTSVTHPTDEAEGHVPTDHPRVKKGRLTRAQDIVFAPIGAKAIVDWDGGHMAVSPLIVIEQVGEQTLDPEVFAALLSSPTTEALGRGATIPRVDLLQVPIPLLSQEQCERLGQALSNLRSGVLAASVFADAAEQTRLAIVEAAYAGVLPE